MIVGTIRQCGSSALSMQTLRQVTSFVDFTGEGTSRLTIIRLNTTHTTRAYDT